jgi:hypothetical protein
MAGHDVLEVPSEPATPEVPIDPPLEDPGGPAIDNPVENPVDDPPGAPMPPDSVPGSVPAEVDNPTPGGPEIS